MFNVGQKVSELRRMTVGELRRAYAEVFGRPIRTNRKQCVWKRLFERNSPFLTRLN